MKKQSISKMNSAQMYLLKRGCDDLLLNDRKCTDIEDRLYSSDMMMEFARIYHETISKATENELEKKSGKPL